MAQETRYYYKTKDGKGYLNLKSPSSDKNLVSITKAQFDASQPQKHEPTAQELAKREIQSQIAKKKAELAATDYKCLKFIDGALTEEEYAPIKAARQELRDEINELEAQL